MSATCHPLVRPTFDPQTESHSVRHDPESPWEASTTLVLALSTVTSDDPMDMLPLSQVVDPDVLNKHVRGPDSQARLSFEFHDHEVCVYADGRIEFSPLDG